jgi:methyl-accepting chemotaxis protein
MNFLANLRIQTKMVGVGAVALLSLVATLSVALFGAPPETKLVADIVGIVALFALLYAMSRTIVDPINGLTNAMKRLSHGEIDVEIPARDRRDEIGEMARTVYFFRDKLIENQALETAQRQQEAERHAQEGETRRRDEEARQREADTARAAEQERRRLVETLVANLEASVGEVIATVSAAIDNLKASAQSMSGTATNASERSTAVAAATEQATANVQMVAAATEQMAASI